MEKQRDWDNAFTGQDNRGRVSTAPSFAGALSFMRRRYSKDLHEVDIAVTGIPVDSATSNRPGARFGPRAIRAISASMSWNRPWPWRIDPLEQLNIVDYGDCVFDFGKPDTIHSSIQEHVAGILDQGTATLTIGGDHLST